MTEIRKNDGDPWENLAIGIVNQAAKDYVSARIKIMKDPKRVAGAVQAAEAERFFHSDWYRQLTSVDADWLIEELRKKAVRKYAEWKKREEEKQKKKEMQEAKGEAE